MAFCVLLMALCLMALWNLLVGDIESEFPVFLLIIVFSLVYIMGELRKEKRRPDARIPLIWGYLFRVALLFWEVYGRSVYRMPHSGTDGDGFYHSSIRIAQGGVNSYGGVFTDVMGNLYSICGTTSLLFGEFILLLFSVVALHMAGAAMKELGVERKIRENSMYILCLLPDFAILSVVFRRESLIAMFVAISLYSFSLWLKRKKEWYFWGAFVAVLLSATVHSGTVAIAVGYIVIRVVYSNRQEKLKLSASGIAMAVLLLFVMTFLYNNYGDLLFGKIPDIENISDIAGMSTRGGSSYAQYVGNSNTPLNMLIYTVPRMVYFLFSPFPWQWRGVEDIIAFCFSALYYALVLVRVIRYLAKGEQENRQYVILFLILAICTAFVFGWGVTNTGTATRHREKATVLYAVLYGLSALKKPDKKRLLR